MGNKAASRKERLFYVIQGGRLQCLNGAYLSEVSRDLARLLLDRTEDRPQHSLSVVREVSTGKRLRELLTRVGQRPFSDIVRENYGTKCCFPDCDVAERTFLRGSHIARWADEPEKATKVALSPFPRRCSTGSSVSTCSRVSQNAHFVPFVLRDGDHSDCPKAQLPPP